MRNVVRVTAAAGTAFGALVVTSAKMAIDAESSFAGVRKTVDATEAQFAALESGLRELSTVMPTNVNDLNRIAEAAGQLGIKQGDLLGFTEIMAKLGETTSLSAEQAAITLARLANVTGLASEDYGRLGSVLVELGNNFAANEQEILSFSAMIAGAGTQVGLSEGEILALGATLASVGLQAESGGRAISRIMIDMSIAVSEGGDKLAEFAQIANVSSEEFARAFEEDAASAVTSFVEGLGRVSESGQNLFKVLEDVDIKTLRVRDTALRLSGATGELSRAVDLQADAWEANTALNKEYEERLKTTRSQIGLLMNKVKDLALDFGDKLLPILNLVIGDLQGVADGARGTGTAVDELVRAMIRLGDLLTAEITLVNSVIVRFNEMKISIARANLAVTDWMITVVELARILPGWAQAMIGVDASIVALREQQAILTQQIQDYEQAIVRAESRTFRWTSKLEELKASLNAGADVLLNVNAKAQTYADIVAAIVNRAPGVVASNQTVAQSFLEIAAAMDAALRIGGNVGNARPQGALAPPPFVNFENGGLNPPGGAGGGGNVGNARPQGALAPPPFVNFENGGLNPPGGAGGGGVASAGGGGGTVRGGLFGGGGGGFGGGGGGIGQGFHIERPTGPGVANAFTGLQPSKMINLNITQNSLVNDPRAKDELRRLISEVLADALRGRGVRLQTT